MNWVRKLRRRISKEKFSEMIAAHELFVRKYGADPGAYLEFGVFKGASAPAFHQALTQWHEGEVPKNSWPMYLYDSFVGLPESTDSRDCHAVWGAGEFDVGGVDVFVQRVTAAGLPRDRFECVAGFYEDSLPANPLPRGAKAAIVNMDCDLYSSTAQALKFLRPHLQSYTLLYFDDTLAFAGHPCKGQLGAIAEFNQEQSDMGITRCPLFTGQFEDRIYWVWRD
jgi:hypothetical protein